MPYSISERQTTLKRINETTFDLLVIGGGINGAAIARDAALRGYRTALVEQNDFAFGTSSRSTRLIHGGLRYLEHYEFSLVFESVSERYHLSKLARHLVRPLPFVFPVYAAPGHRHLALMRLGLILYDGLALFRNYHLHEPLNAKQTADKLPGLISDKLRGSILYYDYQTDDARLVLENVLSAISAGAVALSYCRAEEIVVEENKFRSLRVRDLLSDQTMEIKARALIVAAGPWIDGLFSRTAHPDKWLRPTKGVHIVLPRQCLPLDYAVVMRHPRDGRVLFAIPYHERVMIGTTDTDHFGPPEAVNTTAQDVQYLLGAAAHYFPAADLSATKVISTWSGLRPLLCPPDIAHPSAVSREHRIEIYPEGIIGIAGGKLTTYRTMAAECVDRAKPLIAAAGGSSDRGATRSDIYPLPGAEGLKSEEDYSTLIADLNAELRDPQAAAHLANAFGSRATTVLSVGQKIENGWQRIDSELPYIWAELVYAAREEMVLSLADALVRRTQIFYRALDQGAAIAQRAAELIGQKLAWSAEEQRRQLQNYRQLIAENRRWQSESLEATGLSGAAS